MATHYQAIFLFDVRELLVELEPAAIQALRRNRHPFKPHPEHLIWYWFKYWLVKDHHLVINTVGWDWLQNHLDDAFLNQDTLRAKRMLYRMAEGVLHPQIHPCFHAVAELDITSGDLGLYYRVEHSY